MQSRKGWQQRVTRQDLVNSLKAEGKTYKEISKILGVSRQRVQQLITPDREREKIIEENNQQCAICGKKNVRLDVHHRNYLTNDAILLCISCHRKEHKKMTDTTFHVTRIRFDDLIWLRERAMRNHRTVPQEISAIRELIERHESIRVPIIGAFTGKGDEIGQALKLQSKKGGQP